MTTATNTRRKPQPKTKPPRSALRLTAEQLDAAESEGTTPAAPSEAYRDLCLSRLLMGIEWEAFPSDTQIEQVLIAFWSIARKVEGPAIASAATGQPFVWFGQDHTRGTPHLEGEALVAAVRRVCGLEPGAAAVPDFAEIKRAGKSRAKADPQSSHTAVATAAVVIEESADVLLEAIDISPWQTRETPSEAEIAALAQSLSTLGLLDPIRVRRMPDERYQHIGGWRRLSAARSLGWQTIKAVVVVCDDATAAHEVIEHNSHEPLNAIERARGLKLLWDQYQLVGRSQAELAQAVGMSQSALSNLIRLLNAPPRIQQRLIDGDISQEQVRQLARWTHREKVIATFEAELFHRSGAGPVASHHWSSALRTAIERNSKPLKKSSYDPSSPLFAAAKYSGELDVEVVSDNGTKEERAFNVKRWKQLQAEAKAKAAQKTQAKATDLGAPKRPGQSSGPSVAPRTDRSRYDFKHQMEAAWRDVLWTALGVKLQGKLSKSQRQTAVRIFDFTDAIDWSFDELAEILTLDQDDYLERKLTAALDQWGDLLGWNTEYSDLLPFAEHFGIEIASSWVPSRPLLQQCELIDLQDLCAECESAAEPSCDKPKLIDQLLNIWEPGWVPDIFSPEKPKPKKKGSR